MEQIKPLREMSGKERVKYIWDYYKFPILAVIAAIIGVALIIRHFVTYKDPVLEILMVNSMNSAEETDDLFYDFMSDYGHDPSSEEILINNNLDLVIGDSSFFQQQGSLDMLMATHVYSIFFADRDVFDYYAENGSLRDLREFVSEEILAAYEGSLVYAVDTESGATYPCGIMLSATDNAFLSQSGLYDDCVFGILYSDSDDKIIGQFAEYLLK